MAGRLACQQIFALIFIFFIIFAAKYALSISLILFIFTFVNLKCNRGLRSTAMIGSFDTHDCRDILILNHVVIKK